MAVDLRGELTVAPTGSKDVVKTMSSLGIDPSFGRAAKVRGQLTFVNIWTITLKSNF